MRENPLVSVIVPVFKVEKYISECIESLMSQSYNNIEIIIIDDGSPDNSGQVCDNYALLDSRITVIHKQNEGVSAARRVGACCAKGEYLMFVDGDDTIPNNSISNLYEQIGDTDCVVGEFRLIGADYLVPYIGECVLNRDDVIRGYLRFDQRYRWELTGKLYRKQLFTHSILDVDSKIVIFEDYLASLRYLLQSNSVTYINMPVYHYRIREDSCSHTRVVTPQMAELLSDGIISAFGEFAHDYYNDLCASQEYLLSSVIFCRNLSQQTDWLQRMRKMMQGKGFSSEGRLLLFLALYCRWVSLRKLLVVSYRICRRAYRRMFSTFL